MRNIAGVCNAIFCDLLKQFQRIDLS